MQDKELQLVMLEGECPKCNSTHIECFEDADDSMQFDCLNCGWSDSATDNQILKYVALAAEFPMPDLDELLE